MNKKGTKWLHFLCSIILPPVGHSSNHEYQDNRAVVRIFTAFLRFSFDSPLYIYVSYTTISSQPLHSTHLNKSTIILDTNSLMFKMSNISIRSWFNSTHGHTNHHSAMPSTHICVVPSLNFSHILAIMTVLMVEISTFRPLSQE